MAKSRKGRRSRSRPARTSSVAAEAHVTEKAAGEGPAEQFQQEYAYVIKDLRRVFLLAAAMFVLLIVLNLVLQ